MRSYSNMREYKQWLIDQSNLPLDELIAEPNCGFDCPAGAPFSCGCDDCAENGGHYADGEIEERKLPVSDEEQSQLTPTGCKRPRKYRSRKCLRTICGKQQKIADILKG